MRWRGALSPCSRASSCRSCGEDVDVESCYRRLPAHRCCSDSGRNSTSAADEEDDGSAPSPTCSRGSGWRLVGGVASGLLGVSPGGGLVVSANLLLGSEQHVAQGISLFAQIPPGTLRDQALLGKGQTDADELAGSPGRRLPHRRRRRSAGGGQRLELLSAMDLCRLSRRIGRHAGFPPSGSRPEAMPWNFTGPLPWPALLGVGFLAGFSSGFLGIGGGLAIPAELSAGLSGPSASGAIGQPRLFDNSDDDPRGVDLLAGRLVRAGVADRRGRHSGSGRETDLGARMANRAGETRRCIARCSVSSRQWRFIWPVGRWLEGARRSASAALAFTMG